jgi:hypothetical protein
VINKTLDANYQMISLNFNKEPITLGKAAKRLMRIKTVILENKGANNG